MNYNFNASMVTTTITIVSIVCAVLSIIAYWKIFEKAGEKGWKALIPFYDLYILFKITWGNGWKFLLLLIPFAIIVFVILTQVKLGKAFRKSGGFIVGLILVSIVFELILAFNKDEYAGVPQA